MALSGRIEYGNQAMKYRNLILEEANQPATDAEIESLEGELGSKLPEDYRLFLKSCNGGYLEYDTLIHFEEGPSEYLCFSELYSVNSTKEWGCNPFQLRQARTHEAFPNKGVIPIARDGGSSILYLDLRDGYKIVALVLGLPEWTGLRQEDSLVVVADSFDEYLQKLTISDAMIREHIENFEISETSVRSTIEWLDSVGLDWRNKYRTLWNNRVPFNNV